MIKVEDIRIGQDVFYLDHDAYEVKTFVVKGIMQGYDQDEWHLCSKLFPRDTECLNIKKCYVSIAEAVYALDIYCTQEIEACEKNKNAIDLKVKKLRAIKDEILERCR